MSITPEGAGPAGSAYQVAVALQPLDQTGLSAAPGALPGTENASGRIHGRADTGAVIKRGREAVDAVMDALAGEIARAAQSLADAIETDALSHPKPGEFGLDSVEVSFGVTLSAGIQALFTAQAQSSAQVTLSLKRQT